MKKKPPKNPPRETVKNFFGWSDLLDHDVVRPLWHIKANWELTWDHSAKQYEPEEDSFAKQLNQMIDDIADTAISSSYHENEDVIANHLASRPGSKIVKKNGRWIGADYGFILEQGAFDDINQAELLTSAIGRISAAIEFNQLHYDDMEQGHRLMLADILTIILYHRSSYESDDWSDI